MATTTTSNNGQAPLTAARISQGIKLSVAQKLVAQCKQGALARAELLRLQQSIQANTPTGKAAKLATRLESIADDTFDRAHQLQRSTTAATKIGIVVGLPVFTTVVVVGILAHASLLAFGIVAIVLPIAATIREIVRS